MANFDAAKYLDSLSMHGPSGNLNELDSKAVWAELRRRMDPEPEPESDPEVTTCEKV